MLENKKREQRPLKAAHVVALEGNEDILDLIEEWHASCSNTTKIQMRCVGPLRVVASSAPSRGNAS